MDGNGLVSAAITTIGFQFQNDAFLQNLALSKIEFFVTACCTARINNSLRNGTLDGLNPTDLGMKLFNLMTNPSDDTVINNIMKLDPAILIRTGQWTDLKNANSEWTNVFVRLEFEINLFTADKKFREKWCVTRQLQIDKSPFHWITFETVKEQMISAGISIENWLVSDYFLNFFIDEQLSLQAKVPFVKNWELFLRTCLKIPQNSVGRHAMTKENDDIAWIMLTNFLAEKDFNRNFLWNDNDCSLFDGIPFGNYPLKGDILYKFLKQSFSEHGFTLRYFLYNEPKLKKEMKWEGVKDYIYKNLAQAFQRGRKEWATEQIKSNKEVQALHYKQIAGIQRLALQSAYLRTLEALPPFDDAKKTFETLQQAIELREQANAVCALLCPESCNAAQNSPELCKPLTVEDCDIHPPKLAKLAVQTFEALQQAIETLQQTNELKEKTSAEELSEAIHASTDPFEPVTIEECAIQVAALAKLAYDTTTTLCYIARKKFERELANQHGALVNKDYTCISCECHLTSNMNFTRKTCVPCGLLLCIVCNKLLGSAMRQRHACDECAKCIACKRTITTNQKWNKDDKTTHVCEKCVAEFFEDG